MVFSLGALFALPGVRERVQDIYWFAVKVAFFMYITPFCGGAGITFD